MGPRRQGHRIAAAADALRGRADLGPDAFRGAVAGWLDRCGAVTLQLERANIPFGPTLPCVLAILDVIESPPGGEGP